MNVPSINQKSDSQDFYFEAGTLRSALLIASCYEGVQVLRDLLTQAPQKNIIINSLVLVLLISLLLAARKRKDTFLLAALMHLILLPVFVYFWVSYNGVDGSVPYFFFLYLPVIIFTLHGALRFLFLGLYALMISYLLAFPELFNVQTFDLTSREEIIALSIDCFFSALLLSVFFVRVKRRFEKYRAQVKMRNVELKELQSSIISQNTLIEEQKAKVEQLNSDLYMLVQQRTTEVQSRNKMLAEYAFINAHVLRGPLSRVMGLLNLMLLEERTSDPEKVKQVQNAAEEMDLIIRKINDVLH